MLQETVIKRLLNERYYQDTIRVDKIRKRDKDLGISSNVGMLDNQKSVSDFIIYIEDHLNRAKNMIYSVGDQAAMHEVRKIGALCIAAGEAFGMPERMIKNEKR